MSIVHIQNPVKINALWTGSFDGSLEHLLSLIKTQEPHYHCSVNALALYWMRRHPKFQEAILRADLVTPDGASIIWAQKLWNIHIQERIAGIDLAQAILGHAQRQHWSVAFINPRSQLLQHLQKNLSITHPRLKTSMHQFSENEQQVKLIAQAIKQRKVKIIFLGLQMPFQEIWMHQYKSLLGAPLLMGIGGGLEILAGIQKRAPQPWQKTNTEWLYRLLQEPRRRWRAVWRSTGCFAWQLLEWKLDKIIKNL